MPMPKQKPGKSRRSIEIGQGFGRLVVKQFHHKNKDSRKHYICLCSCGNERIVDSGSLHSGRTKSCGCLRNEKARQAGLIKRLPDNGGAKNKIYSAHRRSAKYRKLEFSLTKEDFLALIKVSCYYCGSKPNNTFKVNNGTALRYSGLDRIDSNIGYILSNVVPCCAICNRAKSNLTSSEFMTWISKLCDYQHDAQTTTI